MRQEVVVDNAPINIESRCDHLFKEYSLLPKQLLRNLLGVRGVSTQLDLCHYTLIQLAVLTHHTAGNLTAVNQIVDEYLPPYIKILNDENITQMLDRIERELDEMAQSFKASAKSSRNQSEETHPHNKPNPIWLDY
jgi:predicted component of type VI protein secretion system